MMAPSAITALLRDALIYVLLITALTQAVEDCNSKKCGECIQTRGCQWCSKLSTSPKGKCFPADADLTSNCTDTTPKYVENPQNILTIIEDNNLTEANSEVDISNIVQLKPQRIKLKLRKDEPINIILKYRQAKDYPVDLYYLMDLSNSMRTDKDTVANLGSKIADSLRKHTQQVRLGFGSFVDKVLLPYVDMSPAKLKLPCKDCIQPFSFRNDLPLSNDTDSFKDRVNEIRMSGNMDSPEGGFDALMQVMKCTEQIGWSNARRIIVFSTDAKFHSAGDGRLAGIIERNDEKCHLNEEGEYTHYMKTDYPSVAQINKVAKEEQVNIIFAVSNYQKLYELLSDEIESSSFGILSESSNNVVDLVNEQYLAISSKVELKHSTDDMDEALAIEYFARCPGAQNTFNKSNTCNKLKEGDEIEFKLQITLKKCPNERNFEVKVGTTQEKLVIEVETLCDCNCQKDGHSLGKIPHSGACRGSGTLICGVCECDPEFDGDSCQCSKKMHGTSSNEDKSKCMKDGEECSGHGYCKCGQCNCNEGYDGRLCQCDSQACNTLNSNVACSGRGVCKCDECECNEGYNGTKCECPVDSVCIAPGESGECSGEGECKCGECKCKGGTSGRFCEDCPTCGSGKCQKYKDCVQYEAYQSGEIMNDDHFREKCSDNKTTMRKVDLHKPELDLKATLCTYDDADDGCTFNFTYRYRRTSKDYLISFMKIKACPETPNLLAIAGGAVASIVAIGLVTLILWKVVTTIHDKKEFDHFEEERKKVTFNTNDNPLYHSIVTTTQNPGYRQ